jgi:hypothetical protein
VTRAGQAVAVVGLLLAGCATAAPRIENGVFHSPKGYRVSLPGDAWVVVRNAKADLELRHRDGQSGIVVNAACGAQRSRGPLDVLARHLLSGFRDRSVVIGEDVSVNGTVARHAVVEGRLGDRGEPTTVELYVMRDDRCLYDFLYAAPPDVFAAGRADFDRVVRTLRTGD